MILLWKIFNFYSSINHIKWTTGQNFPFSTSVTQNLAHRRYLSGLGCILCISSYTSSGVVGTAQMKHNDHATAWFLLFQFGMSVPDHLSIWNKRLVQFPTFGTCFPQNVHTSLPLSAISAPGRALAQPVLEAFAGILGYFWQGFSCFGQWLNPRYF